jgi:hypothetical protein
LDRFGCWDASWSVPTAGGITQARKRLGREVLAEVFEQVAQPGRRGVHPRGAAARVAAAGHRRVRGDVPDTEKNAAEFGYAGSGEDRSASEKARVVALAECGTHAFCAAEVGSWATGEKTPANRLYPRLRPDELLTAVIADRSFYSFDAWGWPPGPARRCCGGRRPGWTCPWWRSSTTAPT